jgi:phage FluMu gp28-like protein
MTNNKELTSIHFDDQKMGNINNKQQTAVDSIIEFCQKQMDNDSSIHKGVYLSIIKFCKEQITEESEIHWKTTLLMMTSTDTANVDLNKPLTKPTGL